MSGSFSEFVLNVIRWSENRKIIPRSTPIAQSRKTAEEAAELVEAAAKLKAIQDVIALIDERTSSRDLQEFLAKLHNMRHEAMREFKDAAGDTVVTLVNACALADVDLVECCFGAWDQIKDRKGTLLPNGIFQKEST